jgi:UDP-glucose 4-epimerase/GDP-4-dehydro-6-deoxy-D-mannose reductase
VCAEKLKKKPLYETDIISPRTFYGYTKWLAELIIKNFSEKYDLKFCCGRIFSFYSHKQSKDFLFRSIKNKLKSSNKISIANAHNVIDIQKAEDVVKIIIKLFNKKGQGIINIGSGKGISIKKFAKKISNNKIKVLSNTKKKNFIISNINKLNSVIN